MNIISFIYVRSPPPKEVLLAFHFWPDADLPDGHELVLSRLNATTNQPSFLTSLRYAAQEAANHFPLFQEVVSQNSLKTAINFQRHFGKMPKMDQHNPIFAVHITPWKFQPIQAGSAKRNPRTSKAQKLGKNWNNSRRLRQFLGGTATQRPW